MDEARLIRSAARGNTAAFTALTERYRQRIFAVCFRVLKNNADAQDAAQEALVKIYLKLSSFGFKSQFSSWVFTIARNSALDLLRKKKQDVSMEALSESGFELPSPGLLPETSAEHAELKLTLTALINSLPPEQRDCLVLMDMDGYSIEEIGEILSIPTGTVKSRLHRGREKLRDMLKKEGIL